MPDAGVRSGSGGALYRAAVRDGPIEMLGPSA
jgi:hypothetical protein